MTIREQDLIALNALKGPFSWDAERTYNGYATRLGLPVDDVRSYLLDVKSLEGKLPDGRLTEPIDHEDEDIFEGFTDPIVLETYENFVVEQMQDDILNLVLSRKNPRSELERTRRLALARTIKTFVPQYEPRCISIEEVANVQSIPMGGQPPRGRRHP